MTTPMLDSQVLVLNRVFQAVQVTSVRKAFSLFYKGHVKAVLPDYTTYEFENWCDIPVQPQDEVVLTPSMAIRVPRVIALKDFDRLLNEAAQRAPLGELVDIMDVGYTCAFLSTPYAKHLSGSTLYVDGGVNIVA